ncbi:galactose-specific lectin nattectin-like [Scomber japonicus]|uniref:galactose-specific lectin nattectin-like n=1 Tax=Scomber japonicus TaxID=13676 RepID=UPI002305E527|nr:galactose-specific lectin nattectin-like [Scomber japonicus]
MASGLYVIVLLCLTSGLWIEAKVEKYNDQDCCPLGWSYFKGRCYTFYNVEKDWADAERTCTSHGGNLASIHSTAERNFIRKLIHIRAKKDKTTWLGGYDKVKVGAWLWSDGSHFDFKGWGVGEPNNDSGGEWCMEINWAEQSIIEDADIQQFYSTILSEKSGSGGQTSP